MKRITYMRITYHPKEWVFFRIDKRFAPVAVYIEFGPFMLHIGTRA